jgi:hypothetical protein
MAADEFTWVMSEITTRFQELIGDSSLAAATCHKHINDYYQNIFPEEADVDELKSFYTQATAVSDAGNYALAHTDLKILKPVTCDNTEIRFIVDHEDFFRRYPDDEQYITAPGLAVGVGDSKKVYHADFDFRVSTYSYSKSSSEVTLSGDTIPQNKYGAFGFKIDAEGTISFDAATNNSTGYDTPADAVDDLDYTDSDTAYMGFITVINTASGGFVPGTTALDASTVTDTYTDGKWEHRAKPEAITIFNQNVYARPKPDDIYQLKAPRLIRPAAIDTGAPENIKWGPAIAAGAALYYLTEITRDMERVLEIKPGFDIRINSIRSHQVDQLTEQPIQRSFL